MGVFTTTRSTVYTLDMYTFLSQEKTSISDHQMISINQLIDEMKKKGINVQHASQLSDKLSDYAREGLIPPGKSQYNSDERGASDHYPRWVLNFLEKVDKLENQGYSKDRIIHSLLSHEIDEPPQARLEKIRRDGGRVGGVRTTTQSRNLVKSSFGSFGSK